LKKLLARLRKQWIVSLIMNQYLGVAKAKELGRLLRRGGFGSYEKMMAALNPGEVPVLLHNSSGANSTSAMVVSDAPAFEGAVGMYHRTLYREIAFVAVKETDIAKCDGPTRLPEREILLPV